MPRDRATIWTNLWADDDWRSLGPGAQWLYLHLLTTPTLNYVGVADWRPARISALSGPLTRASVEKFAHELEDARFVHVDDDTEEVMIRSFLRHDGLLQNPNLWKSVGLDFAAVGSNTLRAHIAHEARRLRDEFPNGWPAKKGGNGVNPWASLHLATLLGTPSHTPPERGSDRGSHRGSDRGFPTTTATATTTRSKERANAQPPVARARMDELFDEFWSAWPLKKGKQPARKAFEKAIKSGATLERILAGVTSYKAEIGPSPDWSKVKWPQGWLNDARWEDEPAPAVKPTTNQPDRYSSDPSDCGSGAHRWLADGTCLRCVQRREVD